MRACHPPLPTPDNVVEGGLKRTIWELVEEVAEAGTERAGREAAEEMAETATERAGREAAEEVAEAGMERAVREADEAFDAAQEAYRSVDPSHKRVAFKVLHGELPRDRFLELPDESRYTIIGYYAATRNRPRGDVADAAVRLNEARIEYLLGIRKHPPGGMENFR